VCHAITHSFHAIKSSTQPILGLSQSSQSPRVPESLERIDSEGKSRFCHVVTESASGNEARIPYYQKAKKK
jgi:hypothetical protein